MQAVADMAAQVINTYGFTSIVDLGAGDGGMLQLIHGRLDWELEEHEMPVMWGYDITKVNAEHAQTVRHVNVHQRDFVDEPIDWAELVVITEHLENPHGMMERIGENAEAIIASSPAAETVESHDACHAWVWDMEGYARLIQRGGFVVTEHQLVEGGYAFQVVLGVKP
jgi:hypothetical protein